MKRTNTSREKKLIKDRSVIENLFSNLKSYNRIHVRKDKKYINYSSFIYMGLLKYYFMFADRIKYIIYE